MTNAGNRRPEEEPLAAGANAPGRERLAALTVLLIAALTSLTPRAGFAIVVGVFLVVPALVCWRWITAAATIAALRLQQVAILMLPSYPVLFVIDRGKLEMVVYVYLAAFFCLYYGRRSRWAWIPPALVTRERERRPLRSFLVWDSWSARSLTAAAWARADVPGAATHELGDVNDVPVAASPVACDAGGRS